ncbi:hypothetical protein ILYODFUR_037166 [Ilyodon furcidens]|uniref:Uncharacterized protein n=1 Tax=Ilyodon furcidens TaxID=33524 RepID=A0ABV0UBJ1_9TELE
MFQSGNVTHRVKFVAHVFMCIETPEKNFVEQFQHRPWTDFIGKAEIQTILPVTVFSLFDCQFSVGEICGQPLLDHKPFDEPDSHILIFANVKKQDVGCTVM